jgi:hypothetical protein
MNSLTKALVIALLIMLTVILCICYMEIANILGFYDLIALGFISTLSIVGCIAATVSISMIDTEN